MDISLSAMRIAEKQGLKAEGFYALSRDKANQSPPRAQSLAHGRDIKEK